jgi:hypothetical protein
LNLIAALLSIFLHASIVAVALHKPEAQLPPPKPPTIPAAFMPTDVTLVPKVEDQLNPDALHVDCPDTYEGIGIRRDFSGRVIEVAKGWPADRAGIQVGDVLEPWGFEAVNGFMEFEVHRGRQVVKMKLVTERICFRDGPF